MHAPSLCNFRTVPLCGKVLNYRYYMIYNLAITRGRTEKAGLWAYVPPKVVSGIYL
jgi:hypothetical protein